MAMSIFDRLANSSFPDDQLRNLGDEARNRREWSQAATFYQQYLETAPENAAIWVQLGHAYKEVAELDLAERSYLRALSIDPVNQDTYLQLGHVEKLRGDSLQAAARYRKALGISPDCMPAIEECRNLDALYDSPTISTVLEASPSKPDGDSSVWREKIAGNIEDMAASIAALNAKVLEAEELTSIVREHEALLKSSRGKEIIARLDALAASVDMLNARAPEMKTMECTIDRHDALLRDLPGKEIVGRLDALTSLVSSLNINILEIDTRIEGSSVELKALNDLKQDIVALRLQVEFIKSRLTTFIGRGVALTYLADETPVYVNSYDFGGPANLINGGKYEQDNADVILSFVRDDTVFLDIGANLGFFSLLVAKRVWRFGKVFAFEPHPQLVRLLCASAYLNGLSSFDGRTGVIVVKNFGVSNRSDTVTFTYPEGHLGGGFLDTTGKVASDATIEAEIHPLDAVFPPDFHCDLVKIDVEGHELDVLKGMRGILERTPQLRVVFEKLGMHVGNESELEKFLNGLGFELFLIGVNGLLTPLSRGALASSSGYIVASHTTNPIENLDRARFEIYPRQLSTIGSVTSAATRDLLEASGKLGEILFHGPYWFLRRGTYAVRFHGSIIGGISIAVTSRFGYPEFSFELNSECLEASVVVVNDVVQFECVGRVASSTASIVLKSLEWIKQA